ncbi:PEP-CTERM sorting domain-containing protein [Planktothrix sp. FACHB-1365]|uniref:PEP-CTERM sorting domain-containing protein n=1 Tax=Planktothrix sp. FACHB-1365 TaxID=2692855 RepID=UPI0016888EF1|nr:PEP-CTERM sorting domain-containing protein [Planktothrix sp. FACHB-1365]MBD2481017.1 PEP-CTERM sorting domain-containing protein [Planktothrix sp. FACHB-1365]
MNITPKTTLKLFLVATPVIALLSSVSPVFAGTLAKAETNTLIFDFNQVPTNTSTFTDAQTLALAVRGITLAEANANANFNVCLEPENCLTLTENSSQAKAQGEGQEYLGLAYSQAVAIGYQFKITENQEFSFKVSSLLNSEVIPSSFSKESAQAENYIAFYLFDDLTDNLLDFFSLNSSLNSSNQLNLSTENSQGFHWSPLITTNAQDNQVSANIVLSGLYSREFSHSQSLTLITYQHSKTMVKAPEPSTSLSLLIMGILGIVLNFKKKSILSD